MSIRPAPRWWMLSKTNRILQDIANEIESLNAMLEAINANLSALVSETNDVVRVLDDGVEQEYRKELKS